MCTAGRFMYLLFLTFSIAASEQDAEQVDATDAEPPARVEVSETTSDLSIADRLRGIYEATGRYNGVAVRVEDGVVFVEGEAESEEARRWAVELAMRTEGVVAVNDDFRVAPQPIWSLAPAIDEGKALWRDVVTSAPLFGIGVVSLAAFVVIGRTMSTVLAGWLVGRIESQLVRAVVQKVVLLIIVLIGVYVFLRISGLTRLAVTVVGGTGLAGIILGFAFRDIAENFLASVLISVQRPFRLGDTIEVEGHLGIVQKVTMRGTLLIDFDGNHIQIANALVYKSTIKNFTANPKARVSFTLGVGYDSDLERAQQIAVQALRSHEAILSDPSPSVLVEALAASTVNLQAYFWIDGSSHSILKLKSIAQRHVLNALVEAGISMPDEQREVIFPDGVPVALNKETVATRADDANPLSSSPQRRASPSRELEAEGGLESEANDIRRQGNESRQPEEGADILASESGD